MNKLTNKKQIARVIFLCAAAYFISYLTRKDYSAIMTAYIETEGVSKTSASLPGTGLFITYGVGQLISGYLGDRIPPRHIITGGFILTTLMNVLMPLAPTPALMMVIWSVNGLAQAMMWPPLVKIMTCAFDDDVYRRACVLVSYGSSLGTVAVYLIAPVFVSDWRMIFYVCGAGSLLMVFLWNIFMNRFEAEGMPTPDLSVYRKKREDAKAQENGTTKILSLLGVYFVFIMIAIIMQGMIRDGVTDWMPTYINETFHLGSAISILTGVVLPLFAMLSFEASSWLNKRIFPNELLCAGVIATVSLVCSLLLALTWDKNAIPAIILIAVIVASMHGVNLILICMLPSAFTKYGNVSFVSGLLNFCTYIGSAISTYGMAKISDLFGWNATILSWALISFIAALCCFVGVGKWERFKKL